MATAAYFDGRKAGYYGNVKSDNPYRRGWARHGWGDQFTHADDWDRGYDAGEWLRQAGNDQLMQALGRLGSAIKAFEAMP